MVALVRVIGRQAHVVEALEGLVERRAHAPRLGPAAAGRVAHLEADQARDRRVVLARAHRVGVDALAAGRVAVALPDRERRHAAPDEIIGARQHAGLPVERVEQRAARQERRLAVLGEVLDLHAPGAVGRQPDRRELVGVQLLRHGDEVQRRSADRRLTARRARHEHLRVRHRRPRAVVARDVAVVATRHRDELDDRGDGAQRRVLGLGGERLTAAGVGVALEAVHAAEGHLARHPAAVVGEHRRGQREVVAAHHPERAVLGHAPQRGDAAAARFDHLLGADEAIERDRRADAVHARAGMGLTLSQRGAEVAPADLLAQRVHPRSGGAGVERLFDDHDLAVGRGERVVHQRQRLAARGVGEEALAVAGADDGVAHRQAVHAAVGLRHEAHLAVLAALAVVPAVEHARAVDVDVARREPRAAAERRRCLDHLARQIPARAAARERSPRHEAVAGAHGHTLPADHRE